jgi:queuine tRNA-ribosyltransferase
VIKNIRLDNQTNSFSVTHSNGQNGPRTGLLQTPHGSFETPCFLPVATFGDLRALSFEDAVDSGTQIIMVNAWHLYNKVGPEKLQNIGGIHKLINWTRPIFTDSGGYQIFSFGENSKISDEGVVFTTSSGKNKELLTPEHVVNMQKHLGSNITTTLDDCAPYPCSYEHAKEAMLRTTLWASKSVGAFNQIHSFYSHGQDLWGIIQGGVYEDLRKRSVEDLVQMEFGGYGIGGLSIGMPRTAMREMTSLVCELLPFDKPRHLLGTGLPSDILEGVEDGVDMFDCILPIRKAQEGVAYTSSGIVRYRNSDHVSVADLPLDIECSCTVCEHYSREQLRRLYRSEKNVAVRLAAIHNLFFYHNLLEGAREAIRQNKFSTYKKTFLAKEEEFQDPPITHFKGSIAVTDDKNKIDENKEVEKPQKLLEEDGIAHIKVSSNNIHVTITKTNGDVICWGTPGSVGFKGSRKVTQLAAQLVGDKVAKKAIERGLKRVQVKVKGMGELSDLVISAIESAGIEIT